MKNMPIGIAGLTSGLLLASVLISTPSAAQSSNGGDSAGPYFGVGVADVHGWARATGELNESETGNSPALRLAAGYSLPLPSSFSLGAEVYDLPTHSDLGLGDKSDNVFGVAVLPAYRVTAACRVFVSLGFERMHTNSPVDEWHDFNSRAPVYGAGASYSFAASGVPLSLTARFEQAEYQRLAYLGQLDSARQTRFVLSTEFHF